MVRAMEAFFKARHYTQAVELARAFHKIQPRTLQIAARR
jgi:hypothetical protein